MCQKVRKVTATQVGDPLIRRKLRHITTDMLGSAELQKCLSSMRAVNAAMKGVGISANQVGYDLRMSIIHIKPNPNRPYNDPVPERVMCNAETISTPPAQAYLWEGCLSVAEAGLFVKVKRSKRLKIRYMDLSGAITEVMLDGLEAQIAQHEIDHLNGIIFLDQSIDTSTFMSGSEYRLMRAQEKGINKGKSS